MKLFGFEIRKVPQICDEMHHEYTLSMFLDSDGNAHFCEECRKCNKRVIELNRAFEMIANVRSQTIKEMEKVSRPAKLKKK